MQQYLKFKEINVNAYLDSTKNFLFQKFRVGNELFSYLNPSGQLILVVKNISRLIFFYIKDAAQQNNFLTANRNSAIYGLAALQGHNAFRGSAARLVFTLVLKKGVDVSNIKGGSVLIVNNTRMNCMDNGLVYTIETNSEYESINLNGFTDIKFGSVQGSFKTTTLISDGSNLQTYSITISPNEIVDNELVSVSVNDNKYNKYESLHNSLFMDRLVMVKTGLSSGFDLIFGKANSNTIPLRGETITVKYLLHNGTQGNIEQPTLIFKDNGYDIDGNLVNLNDIFTIVPSGNGAYFGAPSEDIKLTKLLAPNITPNAIIHDKKSLMYNLNMMNLFSNTSITRDKSTYKVILYPKIGEKLNTDQDYFSFDQNKLLLNNLEKERISAKLKTIQSANIEISISNPNMVNFGISLVVEIFGGTSSVEKRIGKDIRSALGNYMLSLTRLNKIPLSDVVRIIDDISGVDSVYVRFVVSKVEHIDSLGNLVLNESDVAVLRGGFINSNGNMIEDSFDSDSNNSCVNIEYRYV